VPATTIAVHHTKAFPLDNNGRAGIWLVSVEGLRDERFGCFGLALAHK